MEANLIIFLFLYMYIFVEILVNFKVNLKQSVLQFMYFLKLLSNFTEKSLKQHIQNAVE